MKKQEKTKQHFLCFFIKVESFNLRDSDFLIRKDASVALLWKDLKTLMPLSNSMDPLSMTMWNEGKKKSRKSLKFLILSRNITCEMGIPK